MVVRSALKDLVKRYGWLDIPSSIVTREGKIFDSSGDTWALP